MSRRLSQMEPQDAANGPDRVRALPAPAPHQGGCRPPPAGGRRHAVPAHRAVWQLLHAAPDPAHGGRSGGGGVRLALPRVRGSFPGGAGTLQPAPGASAPADARRLLILALSQG